MILPFPSSRSRRPSRKKRRRKIGHQRPSDAVVVSVVGVLVGVRVYGDLPVNWLECSHRSSPGSEESELVTPGRVATLQ